MKKPLIDKVHDRLWTLVSDQLTVKITPPSIAGTEQSDASVSGAMDWPRACAALANGTWKSKDFRRIRAVRQVVETLGPVDGRHFAKWIRDNAPEYLSDKRVAEIDAWGDPIRWPAGWLGTPRSFSPTTLRYLAHALWLKREGFVREGGSVIELGVGFGGLAAMNAIVSNATTIMVDLPSVIDGAILQMKELGLVGFASTNHSKDASGDTCFISNYAFTELSRELQDDYADQFIHHANRGVILSNAAVFANHMLSRKNTQLIDQLAAHGAHAKSENNSEILCPSDRFHGNLLIHWMNG